MVDEGMAPSRARAQAMIAGGIVEVAGRPAAKASERSAGAITLKAAPDAWVSRAAQKLLGALDGFGLAPSGIAVDIGASTGGFTEVLLSRGAAEVHAVDVGHGQLHPRLVADPRVIGHEGVNARALPLGLLPPPDWITADVSFISLVKVLPGVLALARDGAWLVALIKPQFEVGRAGVAKGGIVRDPALHAQACETVEAFLTASGWHVLGVRPSPITGADGNREFLLAARKGALRDHRGTDP